MAEGVLRHKYSNDVDSLRIAMGSFRRLAEDDPQRPQVLNLRARIELLSMNLRIELKKCKYLLSNLPKEVYGIPHGGLMAALRRTLTEECREEKHICTTLQSNLDSDLYWTGGWRNELLGVGQE